MILDMDKEKGKPPREGRSNTVVVHIRRTKDIDLSIISAYLAKKTDFNNSVLEAVSESLSLPRYEIATNCIQPSLTMS